MTLHRKRRPSDVEKILASGKIPRFWTLPEACVLLRRSKDSLRLDCHKGIIQHIRSGRKILIPRYELERILQRELTFLDYEYVVKVLYTQKSNRS